VRNPAPPPTVCNAEFRVRGGSQGAAERQWVSGFPGRDSLDRRQFLSLSAAALAFVGGLAAQAASDPPDQVEAVRSVTGGRASGRWRVRRGLTAQVSVSPARFSSDSNALFRARDPLPKSDAGHLLVLSYHDIVPALEGSGAPQSAFALAADDFASHLRMLRVAGFRSVRLRDVVAARRAHRPLPARSVLITFDDGSRGQWVYADRALAAEDFTAVAFLITGYVANSPFYVDWDEARAMADSGRWEIADHTHLGHHRVPTGRRTNEESALLNRIWDPRSGRLELRTIAEQRVRADLRKSFATIVARGLPRPEAFAFPFSQVAGPTNDRALASWVDRLLAREFALRFSNDYPGRLATPVDVAGGLLPRLEVHAQMDARGLFRWIQHVNDVALPIVLTAPQPWLGPRPWLV
jgi:peptidoglycan/xylan/chitin deacetylase (PgdA/CDA1 family)